MDPVFAPARSEDSSALVALHTAVAEHLTDRFGPGPWTRKPSEKGIQWGVRTSRVFIGRRGPQIVAALRLATKKPWAIDTAYFTDCLKPIYLLDMAVEPAMQRQGIGRWCLEQARKAAMAWPADAIRLDAYDAPAGAGGFYARCGFAEVGRVIYRKTPLIYYEFLLPRPSS
jgi:GNAT superfamily N-acetyltransferase